MRNVQKVKVICLRLQVLRKSPKTELKFSLCLTAPLTNPTLRSRSVIQHEELTRASVAHPLRPEAWLSSLLSCLQCLCLQEQRQLDAHTQRSVIMNQECQTVQRTIHLATVNLRYRLLNT